MKSEMAGDIERYPIGVKAKGKLYFFVLKNIFCRLACWLWVLKASGEENIPHKGPFIIASNHQSYFDFMVVTFIFRKVRFLSGFIKDAYFDIPCLNYFLRDLEQIRVDRERRRDSIEKAIEILNEGHVVVIFPEGTRNKKCGVGKFYRGLGLIAQALPNVPVIPLGISGTSKIWPHGLPAPRFFAGRKVRVAIGKPMRCFDYGGDADVFSQEVRKKIIEMK